MKNFNVLLTGLLATTLAMAGCVKDEQPAMQNQMGGEEGTLTVTLQPKTVGTRALLGTSNEDAIAAFEKNIVDFRVFLFDGTDNTFVKSGSAANGAKSVIFSGLNEGDDFRIIAIANSGVAGVTLPTDAELEGIEADDAFDALTVDLASQISNVGNFTDLTKGFVMSGEYGSTTGNGHTAYTVQAASNNPVAIPVERVVAKIELGDITFAGDITVMDIIKFNIKAAGVQKAISHSFMYPGEIQEIPEEADVTPTAVKYFGAFSGGASTSDISLAQYLSDTGEAGGGLIDLTQVVTNLLGELTGNLGDLLGLEGIVGGTLATTLEATLGTVLNDVSGLLDDLVNGTTLPVVDELLGYLGSIKLSAILGLPNINLQDLIATSNNFWYVLPNSDVVTNPTLFTLSAEYDGDPYFYPVAINTVNDPAKGTDGTGILRNHVYHIDLTFTNSLLGTDNPDSSDKGTNMIVTLSVNDWEGPINQGAEW